MSGAYRIPQPGTAGRAGHGGRRGSVGQAAHAAVLGRGGAGRSGAERGGAGRGGGRRKVVPGRPSPKQDRSFCAHLRTEPNEQPRTQIKYGCVRRQEAVSTFLSIGASHAARARFRPSSENCYFLAAQAQKPISSALLLAAALVLSYVPDRRRAKLVAGRLCSSRRHSKSNCTVALKILRKGISKKIESGRDKVTGTIIQIGPAGLGVQQFYPVSNSKKKFTIYDFDEAFIRE